MGSPETPPRPGARISVIIPAYNAEAVISACLDRLVAQTLPPYEVIVVDDGSSDQTIVRASVHRLHATILKQPHADAAQARNTGTAQATGDFILFCDADVLLASHALERFADALHAAPEAAFAYSSFVHGKLTFHAPPFSHQLLRQRNFINTTTLIRRAELLPFDTALARFQDWDFFLTLAERGKTGVAIPDVLFESVMHGKGKSTRGFVRWFRAYQIIRHKHQLPLDLWSVARQLLYQFGR